MTSKTLLTLAGLAALVLLANLAAATRADEPPEKAPFDPSPFVALSGPDSRIAERGYVRITDREAWVDLWLRHVGAKRSDHSDYYNPFRVPTVDFARAEVVAVFQGAAANSAGVDVKEAIDGEGEIVLRFDDRSYQTMNHADASTAYGLFVVPKSAKPIVLFENVQGTIGGEPVWKERGRLE